MIHVSQWPSLLLDPRGRVSRVGLLASVSLMLGIEAFLVVLMPEESTALPVYFWPLKTLALWAGMVGLFKRLHDVGRSAWWILAGMAALCIWCAVVALIVAVISGSSAFLPGSTGYIVLLGLVMLPAIGVTFWLHLEPGDPFPNRFGPPPVQAPEARQETAVA
jgi:uncharacterized membrane protein YhaH (DUF805 family)